MATKVYKLRTMQALKYSTTYLGTTIKDINFTPGMGGINFGTGEYTTSNLFIQDAMENDPNFGSLFYLYKTYGEADGTRSRSASAEQKGVGVIAGEPVRKTRRQKEAERKNLSGEPKDTDDTKDTDDNSSGEPKDTTDTKSTKKGSRSGRANNPSGEPKDTNEPKDTVKTFKNVNDAIEYLEEELGVDTMGKTNEQLFEEYNIEVKA